MSVGVLGRCIQCCRWFPVLFIFAVIVWSYYAYVVELCILIIESIVKKTAYLILYHAFLIIFLASYYKIIFSKPKTPPKEFYLTSNDIYRLETIDNASETHNLLLNLAKNLPLLNYSQVGGVRYCEKCKCIKPDRCHHCSLCEQCILKMDHHCPWVNNCVGYSNYKYFFLFLFYAVTYCLYVTFTSVEYFIKTWTNDLASLKSINFHILFLFFVSFMFAISVSILLFYHLFLIAKNRSTLESFRPPIFQNGPDKNGFNLGALENFKQVFGNNKLFAFIPIFTSKNDGVNFPTSYSYSFNREFLSESINSGSNQVNSLTTYQTVENNTTSNSHQQSDFAFRVPPSVNNRPNNYYDSTAPQSNQEHKDQMNGFINGLN